MTVEIISLVSRRQDLLKFTPCQGKLLEVGPTQCLAEADVYHWPSNLKERDQAHEDELPGVWSNQYDIVLLLPGLVDPLTAIREGAGRVKEGGMLGIAMEDGDGRQLQTALLENGLQVLMVIPWALDTGIYAWGMKPKQGGRY